MKKTILFTILMVFIISYGNAQWSGQVHYPTTTTLEYGNNLSTPVDEDYNSIHAFTTINGLQDDYYIFPGARRFNSAANNGRFDLNYLRLSTSGVRKFVYEINAPQQFHDKVEVKEVLHNQNHPSGNELITTLVEVWQDNGIYPDEYYSLGIAEVDPDAATPGQIQDQLYISYDGCYKFKNPTMRLDPNNPDEYYLGFQRENFNCIDSLGFSIMKLNPSLGTAQYIGLHWYVPTTSNYEFQSFEYDDQNNSLYVIARTDTFIQGNLRDLISVFELDGTSGGYTGNHWSFYFNFNFTYDNIHTTIKQNGLNPPTIYVGYDGPNNGVGVTGIDLASGAIDHIEIMDPDCDDEITSMRYNNNSGSLLIGSMSKNCITPKPDVPNLYEVTGAVNTWPPASPTGGRWINTSPGGTNHLYEFADLTVNDNNGHRLFFGYSERFPITGTPIAGGPIRNNLRIFDIDNPTCYAVNTVASTVNQLVPSSYAFFLYESFEFSSPNIFNNLLTHVPQASSPSSEFENCAGGGTFGTYKKDPNTTSTEKLKDKNKLQNYEVAVYDLVGHKLTEERLTSKNMKELKVAVRQKLRNISNLNNQMLLVVVSNENGERIDSYKEIQF
jgi:hypothetical protein